MKKNMGKIDRIVRAIIGIVILVIGYMNESYWGLIGLVPLLTASISFCPLYAPFKISTNKE